MGNQHDERKAGAGPSKGADEGESDTNRNVSLYRAIKKRWRSADVVAIQTELKRRGLYSGPIDGDCGPMTRQGIARAVGGVNFRSDSAANVLDRLKSAPTSIFAKIGLGGGKDGDKSSEGGEKGSEGGGWLSSVTDWAFGGDEKEEEAEAKRPEVYTQWTKAQIASIQTGLNRMQLLRRVDGDFGPLTQGALEKYFRNDEWRYMDAARVAARVAASADEEDKKKADAAAADDFIGPREKPEQSWGDWLGDKVLGNAFGDVTTDYKAEDPEDDRSWGEKQASKLQDRVDAVDARVRAGTLEEADKAFMQKLYGWVSTGGALKYPEAGRLLKNYLEGAPENPMQMDAALFQQSTVVQHEIFRQKQQLQQSLRGKGAKQNTLRSDTLYADYEELMMANHRFILDSSSTQNGNSVTTTFRVDDTYFFQKLEVEDKVTSIAVPGSGETITLPHTLSRALLELGASEFDYFATWTETWSINEQVAEVAVETPNEGGRTPHAPKDKNT